METETKTVEKKENTEAKENLEPKQNQAVEAEKVEETVSLAHLKASNLVENIKFSLDAIEDLKRMCEELSFEGNSAAVALILPSITKHTSNAKSCLFELQEALTLPKGIKLKFDSEVKKKDPRIPEATTGETVQETVQEPAESKDLGIV